LVGHLSDHVHGRDIVNAYQVSATENRGRDRSGRSALDD
jgi:hypothetical protein